MPETSPPVPRKLKALPSCSCTVSHISDYDVKGLAYSYFTNDIKGKVVKPLIDLEGLARPSKRSHPFKERDLGLIDFVLHIVERTHAIESSSLSASFGMALDVTLGK